MHRTRTAAEAAGVAAVAAVVFLAAGCAGEGTKTGERAGEGAHAGKSAATDTTQLVPVTPAELSAVVQAGDAEATLVNVWASWCQPCREEFPDLVKLQRAYADRGFRLVFVSADFTDDLPAARLFLAQQGVDWRTYWKTGDDMQFIDSLDARWSGALPGSFLYDSQGRLSQFWEGKATYATLEERVLPLLHTPSTPDSVEERS